MSDRNVTTDSLLDASLARVHKSIQDIVHYQPREDTLRLVRNLFLRLFLTTFGRLSRGVQLCFSDGPTAGTTLSYAYRNVAHGRFVIGKWIDRQFLNYVGWERARDRQAVMQRVLLENIAALEREPMPVHVLDLASGPADYVEEVLRQSPGASIVCRDAAETSVAAGVARAASQGLRSVRFEQGDALDGESILSLRPWPTLILSVGLYELLDDDAMRASIEIVARALPTNGRFVLVHQVSHANPGIVSELFRSSRRATARLYLRPIQTLEAALRSAGLEPTDALPCGQGWYAVITARKGTNGSGAI